MTTTQTLAEQCGISFRQLDHWARRGYLHAPADGSGHPRSLNGHEAAVCARMAGLVRAGFRPDVAARIARETLSGGQREVDLGEGVRLVFPAPWWAS